MATDLVSWKKFVNWLVFHAIFALFPLMSVWFFRSLVSKTAIETINDFPEILFFALMVCASTVGDLRGLDRPSRWKRIFLVLEAALLVGAVGSAILYGGIRFVGIMQPEVTFRAHLLTYAILLTALLFVTSLTAQILLALVESMPVQVEVNHD